MKLASFKFWKVITLLICFVVLLFQNTALAFDVESSPADMAYSNCIPGCMESCNMSSNGVLTSNQCFNECSRSCRNQVLNLCKQNKVQGGCGAYYPVPSMPK